jgi:hypothetical protein
MDLDPAEIAGLLPFDGRYERCRRRWLDGPHGSREAFDRVLGREVVLNVAWGDSDVGAFIQGQGTMVLDDEGVKLHEGVVVYVPRGVRHKAVGDLTVLTVCIPRGVPHDVHGLE